MSDGVVDNAQPEQLVGAGVLGEAGFFGSVARPFRVRLHNGVVVAVQSADEMVDGALVRSPTGSCVGDVGPVTSSRGHHRPDAVKTTASGSE